MIINKLEVEGLKTSLQERTSSQPPNSHLPGQCSALLPLTLSIDALHAVFSAFPTPHSWAKKKKKSTIREKNQITLVNYTVDFAI